MYMITCRSLLTPGGQASSKSSLPAPHNGHTQSEGSSSKGTPRCLPVVNIAADCANIGFHLHSSEK
jgi:hypothetical protein